MIDDQTSRAIETMALCGCELDSLINMFPSVDKKDIEHIWEQAVKEREGSDSDSKEKTTISCNCS